MKSNPSLVFQQDNAVPHKDKIVMLGLNNQKFETIHWPPQSPDLSPIEMICNSMKMKMKALTPRPRSKEDMSDSFFTFWSEMGDDIRQAVCDKFREKLRAGLKAKGNTIINHARKKAPKKDTATDDEGKDYSDSSYEE